MALTRAVKVALQSGVDEFDSSFGLDVAGDGDDALATERADGERERVVAGKHREILGAGPLDDLRDLCDVAACGLVRPNVLVGGELCDRLRLDVLPGSTGDVVDDLWEIDRVGHRAVMLGQARLFGLVVVRRNQEERVGAGAGGPPGEADRLVGGVRPGARDHGHVVDGLDDRLDDLNVFVVGECGALAGGAGGHESRDARVLQALGVGGECFVIDTSVGRERRGHRGEHAGEVEFCHCGVYVTPSV